MQKKEHPFMYLLVIVLAFAAVYVGNKYLKIEVSLRNSTPPAVAPVVVPEFSVQQIPESEDVVENRAGHQNMASEAARISSALDQVMEEAKPQLNPEQDLARMSRQVQAKGGQIVDQRMFATMNECQAVLYSVVSQYQGKGSKTGEMTDSTPYLAVPGSFIAVEHNGENYYVSCLRDHYVVWGAYVQFRMPKR